MGWVAYKLKRTNTETGAVLGSFTAIFPRLDAKIALKNKYMSLSQLLAIPEFPIEAHVIAEHSFVERVKGFGFGNVIDASLYNGETWFLDNGSSIIFNSPEGGSFADLSFLDKNGTSVYGTYASNQDNGGWIAWFPCFTYPGGYIGNMEQAKLSLSLDHYNQIKFEWDVPERVWHPSQFPFFTGATPVYITSDPYGDGGESETGGGTGDFDSTGDAVDIPALPPVSSTDAGFITLFNPSTDELRNLASYMWSDLFDINGWKKVFADPMQAILGLSIVPVNVPAGGSRPVKVGNISTDVSMTVAASQYVAVDCGTLNVKEFWGAYLDYDPYTKVEIYLPYIGIHALSTDDVMSKAVHVVYHVDILSGSCCAYVKCGDSVLYSFAGQCSSSVPITGDNWTNVINGALSIAGSIGSMVATGGASAPSAIGNIASAAINSMKPAIEKSGSMGGTGGMLGIQTPYLILTRPRQAVPRDQNKFIGYPSYITAKLGDLEGYTEIDSIHLENIGATESELSEIESILKGGVIF